MESHDHPHDARDTTAETPEHSHPAQAVQPDTGFEEGLEQTPETPEETQEPDFARGLREGPASEVEDRNRFSEGQEETADAEKEIEGSFATGQEEGTQTD
jgi:uncharacterized protein with von Willebrand factor type A (vWA) domain